MRPARRHVSLLLAALVLLVVAGLMFRRGMALGRVFAFVEIAGRAFFLLWKVVLVVLVLLWLRSALGKKQD